MSGNSVFYSAEEFFAATSLNSLKQEGASLPHSASEVTEGKDVESPAVSGTDVGLSEKADSAGNRQIPGQSGETAEAAQSGAARGASSAEGNARPLSAEGEKARNTKNSQNGIDSLPEKETFTLVRPDVLCVNLDGTVWMRPAAMTGNLGEIRFARDPGLLNESIYTFLYKAFIGENSFLSVAQGKGQIFFTVGSHKIVLIRLNNESISIQGYNVIAFEDKLEHYVHMMGNVAGIAAGGLFFVTLSGSGWAALSVCGSPFTISIEDNKPLGSVPIRTLAWESHIKPEIKTDVTRINLMGRGIVDTLQMVFDGRGRVALHGNEEYMFPKIK
ncbi:AIM24 family protein [bacterium]|nr:AIM24 family protein [bacterium]